MRVDKSVETDSSFTSFSTWSSRSDVSGEISTYSSDQLEGTLYRTETSETKLTISFVSHVFFESLKNKIHADFMSSVEIYETSFVSRCTAHVRGAKCGIRLDRHFKTVELSGIGFRAWREERFPSIAKSLFGRIILGLDSLIEGPSQNVSGVDDSSDLPRQQETQSYTETTNSKDDVNDNVPQIDVSQLPPNVSVAQPPPNDSVANLNVACTGIQVEAENIVRNDEGSTIIPQQSFAGPNEILTAENITAQYFRSVNLARSLGNNIRHATENHIGTPTTSNEEYQDNLLSSAKTPAFTSTPIVQRQNGNVDLDTTSEKISIMMNKIDQLENGIRTIKRDVIQQMENNLHVLKTSLISSIERLSQKSTYANVVGSTIGTNQMAPPSEETSQSQQDSCYIDEGYGDQSRTSTSTHRPSSQTRPKTLLISDNDSGDREPSMVQHTQRITTSQPVPVRVTNRTQPQGRNFAKDPGRITPKMNEANHSSRHQRRTLLIGDSILKGINYRGLKPDVKICSRSGASINDILKEISIYDMNSFANIIICIGVNDCSRGMDTQLFEDKYDQLISIIRSSNKDCNIYVSKIVPRGDIDVSAFNRSITYVVDHRAAHRVKCIDGSYDLFFGHNQIPSTRYFNEDGIHLSYSGTKRLLDAWNRHVTVVEDFSLCVFKRKTSRLAGNIHANNQNRSSSYRRYHPTGYQGQRRGTT